MNRTEISPGRAELMERVSDAIKMSQIGVAICLDPTRGNQIGATKRQRGHRERPIYVTAEFREPVRPGWWTLKERIAGCLIDLSEEQIDKLLRLKWQPAQPKNLIESIGKLDQDPGKKP